jgi:hypothetical protein
MAREIKVLRNQVSDNKIQKTNYRLLAIRLQVD